MLLNAVLASLVLAGCLGGGSPGPAQVGGPGKIGADISDTTGAIRGLVQDDSLLAVEGATVTITELEARATTDAQGRYVLANLPPGFHRVIASRLGFDTQFQRVEVRVREYAEHSFVLKAVPPLQEAVIEKIIREGYIACGVHYVVGVISNTNVCAWDTTHRPQIDFDVEKARSPAAIVLELQWTRSSGATGDSLAYGLWKDPGCQPPPCEGGNQIAGVEGKSPLKLVVKAKSFERRMNAEGATTFSALTFVGQGENLAPGVPVSKPVVVFQQRVTHYISVFYNAEPDANYSLISAG